MKHLILFVVIIVSLVCNGQIDFVKHHEFSMEARRAMENQDFEKAIENYEVAFAFNGAIRPIDYLEAAVCAANLEDEPTCKKWIEASITKEKLERTTIKEHSKDEIYQSCVAQVLPKYDQLIEQFYENIPNKSVYLKIEKLLNRDQFSRNLKDYHLGISDKEKEEAFDGLIKSQATNDSVARKKYQAILFPKVDKVYTDHQNQIMRFTDSLNIFELIEITKHHGWQKEGWLLLWHQRGTYGDDNWVWNYFKPLIDAEIKQGKITPSFWAVFEDITAIRKNGKSIYGYHPGKVNPLNVNAKRREIGLPALTKEEITLRNNNPYGGSTF